jgi:HTH-type transcriptional regulator/antitoxin HigA
MKVKPISTKTDCRGTLNEVETLLGARAGSRQDDRLDALVTLIEAYEKKSIIGSSERWKGSVG